MASRYTDEEGIRSLIEITKNLEVLYDTSIAATDLALHGCQIGDDTTRIDLSLVTGTIHHAYPKPALIWPDEHRENPERFSQKVSVCSAPDYYYFTNTEPGDFIIDKEQREANRVASSEYSLRVKHEWLLADRIQHVITFGGKLIVGKSPYFKATGYRIKEGRVVMIDLNAEEIPFLNRISERDCFNLFGEPDYYYKEPDDEYAEFPATKIGYNRGVYLYYDQWSGDVWRVSLYSGDASWITSGKLETYNGPVTPL